MKKSIVTALLVSLALVFTNNAVATEAAYAKQKVVYHINYDNPKKQAGALRNIQNHINAVGAENLDLKVVMHGHGLSLVLLPEALPRVPKFNSANANPQMAAKIDGLRNQGVSFQACANTIRGRKVSIESDLHYVDQGDIVPSGVAELAHLQAQGYTYIKP